MTTIGQFRDVWTDFSKKVILFGLTEKAKTEINPLFNEFAAEFEKQFSVNIQESERLSQDLEITGDALEKLKQYIEAIDEPGLNYSRRCGLLPLPDIC